MHATTFIASALALASTALAGTAGIKNNCKQDIFLTTTGQNQKSTQLKIAANGGYYSTPIQGQGNSYGLSKSADYYSANTAKLIWGASDSNGVTYYSLNTVNGNPFAGQSVRLSGSQPGCATITSPDGATKACTDKADFYLQVC
ncbi:hypothetical protein E4T52_09512 [Aureobasidium sp. EXF-3400]|nr:hypothetical protein E4T52_09512 [Aureobasidium sp. EXF-3400]